MIKDPRWVALNYDGTPATGAKLYVYENGTDNKVPVYADVAMTVRLEPVADGRGFFPVFFANKGTYKVIVEAENGALISEVENVIVE